MRGEVGRVMPRPAGGRCKNQAPALAGRHPATGQTRKNHIERLQRPGAPPEGAERPNVIGRRCSCGAPQNSFYNVPGCSGDVHADPVKPWKTLLVDLFRQYGETWKYSSSANTATAAAWAPMKT